MQKRPARDVMALQRLILTFKPEELVMHVCYRTKSDANPGTKARAKEVSTLARTGLQDALSALGGRVDVVGTSGFTAREDVFLCTTKGGMSLSEHKTRAKGA